MAVFAKLVTGDSGRVTIPAMGALIGEMWKWELRANEDRTSYVLKADFKHIHDLLWEEAGPSMRIELQVSRDKWYEAKPRENAQILRDGRHLVVKTIDLAKMED